MSHGLKTLPDVKLDRKPRMADFAQWVTACEGALWKKGTFMAAYTGNIQEAVETVLEAEQVATILRAYMDPTHQFAGTATQLLKLSMLRQKPTEGERLAEEPCRPGEEIASDRPAAAQDRDRRRARTRAARSDRHHPLRGRNTVQPSPPSFSNSLNDLEETARRHRDVTDEELPSPVTAVAAMVTVTIALLSPLTH